MRSAITFLLSLLTCAVSLSAQTSVSCPTVDYPKTIRGQVRLPSNAPAPMGILVRVRDRMGGEVDRTQTDDRGKFQFENLKADTYIVEIKERGYLDATERFELICQTSAYADLTLRIDKKNPPAIPPEGPSATVNANAPQKPEDVHELEAGQTVLTQDPKAAAAHFEAVTKAEPDYVPAYLLLATAKLLASDFDAAIQAANTAVEKKPTSPQAHLLRGMALGMKNDFPEAQKALKKSIELNPESYDAQLELGKVLLAAGQLKDAQTTLKKAAELSPTEPFPHVLLGNASLERHDAKSAIVEFKEAVKLAPQGPMAPALNQKIETLEKGLASKQGMPQNK